MSRTARSPHLEARRRVDAPPDAVATGHLGQPHVAGRLVAVKMSGIFMPGALRRLNPRLLRRTPILFTIEVGAVGTSVLAAVDPSASSWAIAGWLWLMLLFGTFAEVVSEGQAKAQSDSLRRAKRNAVARRLRDWTPGAAFQIEQRVPASAVRPGDVVVVETGQVIPADGCVVEGGAPVDETAVTGVWAPAPRGPGEDRNAVIGGTRVVAGRLVILITEHPGESFLDRLSSLAEADLHSTPNGRTLSLLTAALTLPVLLILLTLQLLAA